MSIGCSTKLTTVSEFIVTKILIIATFKNTQLHRQAFSVTSHILTVHICPLTPKKCSVSILEEEKEIDIGRIQNSPLERQSKRGNLFKF